MKDNKLPNASWCVYTFGQLKDQLDQLTEEQILWLMPVVSDALGRGTYKEVLEKMHQVHTAWFQQEHGRISPHEALRIIGNLVGQPPRSLFHSFDLGSTYVAENMEQCWELAQQEVDMRGTATPRFERISDDAVIEMQVTADRKDPDGESRWMRTENGLRLVRFVKKTAKEWANEFYGVGLFCGGSRG